MVHLWTCFQKFLNKNQRNALFSNICTHTIVHNEIKQGLHFSDSFAVSPWFTEKQFFSVQPSTKWKQIVNNRSFCGWTTKSWISIEKNVRNFKFTKNAQIFSMFLGRVGIKRTIFSFCVRKVTFVWEFYFHPQLHQLHSSPPTSFFLQIVRLDPLNKVNCKKNCITS